MTRTDVAAGGHLTARVRDALGGLLPTSAWRDMLAFASSLLTFVCTTGGLFVVQPTVQSAAVAGIAAGLLTGRVARAAVVGAIVGTVGALVGPANAWFAAETGRRLVEVLLATIICAAVAAGVRWMAQRWPAIAVVLLAVAVGLLVVNLWYATLSANSESLFDPTTGAEMPSFDQQLRGSLPEAIAQSDDAWYYRVFEQVGRGEPFYPTFAQALEDNPRWEPSSVLAFRLPTFFLLSRAIAGPTHAVTAFLVLATLTILCVVPLTASFVRAPLALPGCAALAAYFLYFPIQLVLFSQEAWAVMLGIGALTASALSVWSGRWRLWTVLAVVAAVCGVLVRETMVFLPLAGLASAFVGERTQRRFRLRAWLGGVLALAAVFLAHYLAVRPYLKPVAGFGYVGKGGVAFMLAAFDYATDFLGPEGLLPFVLAVLGILAALLVPDPRQRVFALVGTFAPLLTFLVIGNQAWYETTGDAINYWGATVVPLLYAMIPTAFSVVPGAELGSAKTPWTARYFTPAIADEVSDAR